MENSEFRLTGSDVFGRYCRIEMKNFIGPNDFFIHKCIKTYRGNRYRDVPLVTAKGEYVHTGGLVNLVSVITCGIDETEVFAVPLESVEFIPNNEHTCHDARECGSYFLCSRCGAFLADGAVTNATSSIQPRYCPNCGAEVKNEVD